MLWNIDKTLSNQEIKSQESPSKNFWRQYITSTFDFFASKFFDEIRKRQINLIKYPNKAISFWIYISSRKVATLPGGIWVQYPSPLPTSH